MSLLGKPRRLIVLALPLVVLLGLMVRSELILARGREYEVNIEGYDPRDLLRGQYLRYRVRWNSYGRELSECPDCCLCLQRDASRVDPAVSNRECGSVDDCAAFITKASIDRLGQYYIPEGMGSPLEQALRERRASLRIAVKGGEVAVRDLLIDGKPWRAAITP